MQINCTLLTIAYVLLSIAYISLLLSYRTLLKILFPRLQEIKERAKIEKEIKSVCFAYRRFCYPCVAEDLRTCETRQQIRNLINLWKFLRRHGITLPEPFKIADFPEEIQKIANKPHLGYVFPRMRALIDCLEDAKTLDKEGFKKELMEHFKKCKLPLRFHKDILILDAEKPIPYTYRFATLPVDLSEEKIEEFLKTESLQEFSECVDFIKDKNGGVVFLLLRLRTELFYWEINEKILENYKMILKSENTNKTSAEVLKRIIS